MPSVNDWGWKKIQMNHSDDTCDLENHKPHDTLQHMTKPKRKWEIWALQKCNKKKEFFIRNLQLSSHTFPAVDEITAIVQN